MVSYGGTIMSVTDIAKDAIRIASTTGLSKDVIDLLKEKITLLDEKLQSLTQENNTLKAENHDLLKRLESVGHKVQKQGQRPEGFDDTTEKILDMLFKNPDGISIKRIVSHLGIEEGIVQYHFDLLFREKFIRQLNIGFGSTAGTFGLTSSGRACVMKRNS